MKDIQDIAQYKEEERQSAELAHREECYSDRDDEIINPVIKEIETRIKIIEGKINMPIVRGNPGHVQILNA